MKQIPIILNLQIIFLLNKILLQINYTYKVLKLVNGDHIFFVFVSLKIKKIMNFHQKSIMMVKKYRNIIKVNTEYKLQHTPSPIQSSKSPCIVKVQGKKNFNFIFLPNFILNLYTSVPCIQWSLKCSTFLFFFKL